MYAYVGRVLIVCALLTVLSCSERRPLYPVETQTLAHEPWEDAEAENLAWLITGDVYAPRDVYERIRADLATIRDRWGDSLPALAIVKHTPPSSPSVYFTSASVVYDEMLRGEYHDWDSLNVFYSAEIEFSQVPWWVQARSANRVNARRMSQSYGSLRGVTSVSYGGRWDSPNIYACLQPWGIAFLFRHAWGDCPSGCIDSELHYFRSLNSGVEYVGSWEMTLHPDSIPEWWPEAKQAWDLYEYW